MSAEREERRGYTREQVDERIVEIVIEQYTVEKNSVTPAALLIEDLGGDSLDFVELIMTLEEEFDLCITEAEVKGFTTVGEFQNHVWGCLGRQ